MIKLKYDEEKDAVQFGFVARFSYELVQDLSCVMSLDAEETLKDILCDQMREQMAENFQAQLDAVWLARREKFAK
jgi:hypothetical protein